MAPIIGYYAEYVGCSAGCFALLTLDVCHSIEVLCSVFFGGAESTVPGKEEEDVDRLVLEVSSHAMSCYFMSRLMHEQWLAYSAHGIEGISRTDHAGHLIGMAFGLCTFLGLKLSSVLFLSKKRVSLHKHG